MRIRSPKDFWSGLFFIAVAAGFIGLSHHYGIGTMHRMGPGLFPILVGVLLVGLGMIIALRSFAIDGPPVPRFHARPIIVSLIAIALFGVALAHLGLLAAVAVVVLVGALASRESRPLETAGLIVALMVFAAAVFVWLLGLPIPLWPEA
jgi:putative tricarboxylic transport membrane protein